ncbi:HNH endonuclease [Bacillus wiedmannii]|uniref:HNH endonuclease signature motif containing protein n=1 Tax=Bacillus wiedmannii TaxID=1890302 RepID=A0AA95RWK1_9BACI|nr:HNH endonuclease signature motif containing protein [Bacillus wiedmannii]WHY28106.1 HNH endonuclease signature motif containing protein [Bacillus wiedmannii]
MNFSLKYNRFCNCGKLVKAGEKCSCQKFRKTDAQKKHPSGTADFQPLKREVRSRDDGHCQRCRIKFDIMTYKHLQVHHIKSWRDYPELAYVLSNLILVCRWCNLDLGNSNTLDFEWKLQDESNEIPYVL